MCAGTTTGSGSAGARVVMAAAGRNAAGRTQLMKQLCQVRIEPACPRAPAAFFLLYDEKLQLHLFIYFGSSM